MATCLLLIFGVAPAAFLWLTKTLNKRARRLGINDDDNDFGQLHTGFLMVCTTALAAFCAIGLHRQLLAVAVQYAMLLAAFSIEFWQQRATLEAEAAQLNHRLMNARRQVKELEALLGSTGSPKTRPAGVLIARIEAFCKVLGPFIDCGYINLRQPTSELARSIAEAHSKSDDLQEALERALEESLTALNSVADHKGNSGILWGEGMVPVHKTELWLRGEDEPLSPEQVLSWAGLQVKSLSRHVPL